MIMDRMVGSAVFETSRTRPRNDCRGGGGERIRIVIALGIAGVLGSGVAAPSDGFYRAGKSARGVAAVRVAARIVTNEAKLRQAEERMTTVQVVMERATFRHCC
jgi:hypothetical protein